MAGAPALTYLRVTAQREGFFDNPVDARRKRSDGLLTLVQSTGPSAMTDFATDARRRRFVLLLLLGLSVCCWLLVGALALAVLEVFR